ncbi:unnamed protein product [Pseudo-nitzschia multistriata]|uniref:Uncharacterized protein n=1 Tax=Pseudo-nitzschia multistriata TaxID=183589 RepID=A0A448ZM47_9STRA|nr:unnamed protein product [Pseudo-nitzschia multistriata]
MPQHRNQTTKPNQTQPNTLHHIASHRIASHPQGVFSSYRTNHIPIDGNFCTESIFQSKPIRSNTIQYDPIQFGTAMAPGSNERSGETGQQHQQQAPPLPPPRPAPSDGPALSFEADPMVSDIPLCKDGDYAGLVLVTNWPPSPLEGVGREYSEFLAAVRSCFDPCDTSVQMAPGEAPTRVPAVYFQPISALHVTIATFSRIHKIDDGGDDKGEKRQRRDRERKRALALVEAAARLPGWPKKPFRLVVESAQIGKKAGILLWRDLSGGIEAARACLREAAAAAEQGAAPANGNANANTNKNSNSNTTTKAYPTIPGIVHSTVLRFSRVPATPGETVQERFRSGVLQRLGTDLFAAGSAIASDTVRLADETTPYMHFAPDEDHGLRHVLDRAKIGLP